MLKFRLLKYFCDNPFLPFLRILSLKNAFWRFNQRTSGGRQSRFGGSGRSITNHCGSWYRTDAVGRHSRTDNGVSTVDKSAGYDIIENYWDEEGDHERGRRSRAPKIKLNRVQFQIENFIPEGASDAETDGLFAQTCKNFIHYEIKEGNQNLKKGDQTEKFGSTTSKNFCYCPALRRYLDSECILRPKLQNAAKLKVRISITPKNSNNRSPRAFLAGIPPVLKNVSYLRTVKNEQKIETPKTLTDILRPSQQAQHRPESTPMC
uniref:Uncharacterized protein n=1 Tax=Romanomermis culicivorax TaxID=13658 RepID=A0A915JL42_ROMCU